MSAPRPDWFTEYSARETLLTTLTRPAATPVPVNWKYAPVPARPVLDTRASYLRRAFDDPDELIADAKRLLPADVDTLVGQGLSGALVVPTLARALGLHWLMVRKPGDGTHSMHMCEGALGRHWAFVDDLIDTGTTLNRVHKEVHKHATDGRWETQFAGALLYLGKTRFEANP